MNCLISCIAFNFYALRSDSHMMIFFFAKELLLMATCNRCFGFGQILLQQSCNLKKLTNLTKLKYFLSPANHGFAAKGKLFCFCLWYLMAVDLAADANVDYRKDFSETERKLAAGSGIWKVQRRKLRTVVQPSSAVFHVILHFALLFGDWKKVS